MAIKLAPLLLILGLLLTASGGTAGFMPVNREGTSCGSPWLSNGDVVLFGNYAACESARSDRETISLVLGVPGILCLLIGAGASIAESRRRASQPAR